MGLFAAITECIYGPPDDSSSDIRPGPTNEKKPIYMQQQQQKESSRSADDVAVDVIQILLSAEKPGSILQRQLDDVVGTEGWTEEIAKAILSRLAEMIEQGSAIMGQAMQEAVDTATNIAQEIFDFARDHPIATTVFCVVVALGVLALLSLWVVEALGFGELGPIEGSFAAWWQSTYEGYVPAKSLFSFFQRLGMKWLSH